MLRKGPLEGDSGGNSSSALQKEPLRHFIHGEAMIETGLVYGNEGAFFIRNHTVYLALRQGRWQ